jgi:hypothetical protein
MNLLDSNQSETLTDKGAEMPKHALVVKADLTTELLDIADNELRKLQGAVDGLIQPVDIDTITMYVNEEGLLRSDLSPNYIATILMAELGYHTTIMGDVVFTGAPDEEGETTELDQTSIVELTELATRARELLGAIA